MKGIMKQWENLKRGGILYNDNLWVICYVIAGLFSFNEILDTYNVSSVSDSNPISMGIHGVIYLVCAIAVFVLYANFKFLRVGIVEAAFMVAKISDYICADSFMALLVWRGCSMAASLAFSFIIFSMIYKKHKTEDFFQNFSVITAVILGIVLLVYIIFNYKKLLAMVGGIILAVVCLKGLANMGAADVGYVSNTANYKSGTHNSDDEVPSYNGFEPPKREERIAFHDYDFSSGNFAEDFDRIDF